MPSGLSLVWLVTWSLWAGVVYKDWRRQPRDGRWLVSLAALLFLAWATLGTLDEPNLRFAMLAGLAVAVLLAWTGLDILARRRRFRLTEWVTSHGFEPVAIDPCRSSASLPEGLRRLPFLHRGGSPSTEAVMRRDDGDGRESLIFQHTIRRKVVWYDINGIAATGTVVALHRPGMWLPLFQIRPVGIFPWFDGGPLGDSVSVKPETSFARSYRLGGHEPRNLRNLFTDELLATIAEKPGWLIEGEGEWIAAFYFDRAMSFKSSNLRTVKVDQLEEHVRETTKLLERIADRDARTVGRDAGAA